MAKSIMIQGTMSNAGKSLLAGGLCRIFKQDGFKTVPFKSQNMALNSFITKEGLEMGRAQVMQAEAAGIEPRAIMNPILLKPTNDTGSQVIVNGEVYGTMSAMDYYKNKKQFIPHIMEAYHTLEQEYDMIVLEGAGSPAEINLKENDIVNMGMAKMAKAPVLLAGDIDRGGVFAQLLGTIALLEPEEQKYLKGLIINKFRGDINILQPGIEMLEQRGKIPVVGVVPYVYLDIDDEDSLTERFEKKDVNGEVDIVVCDSPILLSIIYSTENSENFNNHIIEEHKKFDSINFLLDRTTKFDQNGRVHNEKESKEIDKKIKKLLSKNSINFYDISGIDSKDVVRQCLALVREELLFREDI